MESRQLATTADRTHWVSPSCDFSGFQVQRREEPVVQKGQLHEHVRSKFFLNDLKSVSQSNNCKFQKELFKSWTNSLNVKTKLKSKFTESLAANTCKSPEKAAVNFDSKVKTCNLMHGNNMQKSIEKSLDFTEQIEVGDIGFIV